MSYCSLYVVVPVRPPPLLRSELYVGAGFGVRAAGLMVVTFRTNSAVAGIVQERQRAFIMHIIQHTLYAAHNTTHTAICSQF